MTELRVGRRPGPAVWYVVCLAAAPAPAVADYKADIGYTQLAAELGAAMPTGAGVPVLQVEAAYLQGTIETFTPNPTETQFAGKTITNLTGGAENYYSPHATGVGFYFYGNTDSCAPGLATIDVRSAVDWLNAGYINTSGGPGPQPTFTAARVANHSWTGETITYDSEILRRLDWAIARDEIIHPVGLNNTSPNRALLASAFNVLAVGRTDGVHVTGSVALDAQYGAGRMRPEIVSPGGSTSVATAQVSGLAALLVQVGKGNAALSTDPVEQFTTNRAGNVVRNAERSEVIKAALMAGASRTTNNSSTVNLTDYRGLPANQTANGLDARYGAGQINIRNSWQIIAAGEQNSQQDLAAGGGNVQGTGFDYDRRFGGSSGTNTTATYFLPVASTSGYLTAALVWNLRINGGTAGNFNSAAYFYNLDLQLYDVTNGANWVLVGASSSAIDNTENLWQPLVAGRRYALQVTRGTGQGNFDWDYALAWHTTLSPPADGDGDGVADAADNCSQVANASQLDSNGDGYGNLCDPDFNDNGTVDSQDGSLLRAAFGTSTYPERDLNGNGLVDSQDGTILRSRFGQPPGPSGLAP
jgi:hypothetical protein